MRPIAVLYATREGHTRRIAEHVATVLRAREMDPYVQDLRGTADPSDLKKFAGAILAASVHQGTHEPEIIAFVKKHRSDLETMPAAFLSVTLSEAGVERSDATSDEHAEFAADVQKMIDRFVAETGWHPNGIKPVAGALLYSKYNFLVRLIMKRIAKKSGGDTDTSRDYEYTNWADLDQFVEEFSLEVCGTER
jgi:menaquinone-dependent protoporphyrinogen oxidase